MLVHIPNRHRLAHGDGCFGIKTKCLWFSVRAVSDLFEKLVAAHIYNISDSTIYPAFSEAAPKLVGQLDPQE